MLNVLAAVIVLWAGMFIAKIVRELLIPIFDGLKVNRLQEKAGIRVEDSQRLSNTLAYIVYVLILIPVIITALRALHISAISDPAIRMLDIIFAFIPNILILIVAALAVAFALSFGIGGREFAGRMLTKWRTAYRTNPHPKNKVVIL